jgi:multidrug resistance protein
LPPEKTREFPLIVSSRQRQADRPPLPPGFGTIWSTVALDLIGFGIILPVLTIYGERFGATPTTLGLLVASFSLAQFVASPLLGRLSDRIGRKPVILLSLFGTAVGSVVTGAATATWVLFAGRIIDGASGASVSVAQGAVTDVAPPDQRARLLGLLGAAFGVGFVLGPALGGLAALGGPRVPFFVAGGIAFVNGLVAIRRLPETHRPGDRRRPKPDVDAPATAQVRRRSLATYALVAFSATAAFAAFEATFALFGQARFGLTEASVFPVFVGIGIVLVAVQGAAIHPLTMRFGEFAVLRAGLVAIAVGLLLLGASSAWPLLIVSLGFLVVGQGLAVPTLAALVAGRARDDRRGAALGVQQSASALARIVGPAIGGLLFQYVGVAAPYVVGAGLVAVALALLVVERPISRERVASPVTGW